jgi:serine/threonine protein kinase
MGCKSSRIGEDMVNQSGFQTQNEIRFAKGGMQQEQQGNFHKNYFLYQKVSQGGYSQVHLACKLEKDPINNSRDAVRGSFFSKSSSLDSVGSKSFEKQPSIANLAPNRSVKIVDLRMKPKNIARLAQNEVDIWKNLEKHNHIVELMTVKQEYGMYFLIMEMCSASLLHYLASIPVADERKLGESFAQMLLGIEFLHKSMVVHRDIKPDHFVVGGHAGHTIKLCDFALATVHDHELTGECGTALFMAPEMVLHRAYDMKVDVWSFGVIIYALLLGRFPYDVDEKDSAEVKQTIASTKEAPSFRTVVPISSTALAFTKSLLSREPTQRPSASQALKNRFMIDIITQSHEVNNDLPNLHDQLHQVKQLRAFQNKDLRDKSEIDDMLNRQQLFVHGQPLPGMKQQSIVVQKLASNKGLDEHQKSKKRNTLLTSEDNEQLGFALGEKVKCARAANGITIGTVGEVVGFIEFHVNVEFPGATRRKFKPSQLLRMTDGRGSARNSNNWSPPSNNWSPPSKTSKEDICSIMSNEDTLLSSLSTQTGSPPRSIDSSSSSRSCDTESEASDCDI